jgi:arylformamidase
VRVTGACAGPGQPGIDVGALAALDIQGAAVLLHTGDDARFGTPAYSENRHFLTLAARIPVVEHLTGLDQLPPTGARFTALPLRIEGTGTIPVRAFARLPE